ncbi:MAG TPA: UDP-2,3-diacylglucosamine diphosphatase [Bacteroidales bacterium]|nr:UDP-2,3-diacylglucosamine diphosphatase [Bacteroidales bacterium]HQQ03022.1 UDP-2,3-diacylglucosamine diphosphatase [Bacteroidales bacterium]
MQNGKKIFFNSDQHFGAPTAKESKVREKIFIDWLEHIAPEAEEIYLMGDLFDFWFDYKTVVPKGYTLLLGALASITLSGIPVHYYRGNHDMWTFNYFEEELGFIMHRKPEIVLLNGKKFYLAHGDGLGPGDRGYKFIKKVFENKINQWLFRQLHPDWGILLAQFWSGKSRYANLERESKERENGKYDDQQWLLNEPLPRYALQILQQIPDIRYFVFGHWHMPIKLQLTDNCSYFNIGDWITHFSYLTFDGSVVEAKTWKPNL